MRAELAGALCLLGVLEEEVRPSLLLVGVPVAHGSGSSGEVDDRLMRMVLDQAERLCVTLDTLRNEVPIEIAAHVAKPAIALG